MISILYKIGLIIYFQATSPLLLPENSFHSSEHDLGHLVGQSIVYSDGMIFTQANLSNLDESVEGMVYAFDEHTLDLLCTIVPESDTPDGHFGPSVAADDGIVAVGTAKNSDYQKSGGVVHLFDFESGQQLHKVYLPNAEPRDKFGSSLDLDNGLLVVGAGEADYEYIDSGVAVVIDVESGEIVHTLFPENSKPYIETQDNPNVITQRSRVRLGFGKSVAIEGNLIAISAPHDSEVGENCGAVYLFDASTGKQLNKITEPVLKPSRLFGSSVRLDNGLLIISAPYTLDNDPENPRYYRQYWGSVYVYEVSTGKMLHRLEPSFTTGSFGYQIEIDDNLIVVAPQFSNGYVRSSPTIFLFDARSGQEIAQLNIPGIKRGTVFPQSLGLSDSHVSVGLLELPRGRDRPRPVGSMHIFDRPDLD